MVKRQLFSLVLCLALSMSAAAWAADRPAEPDAAAVAAVSSDEIPVGLGGDSGGEAFLMDLKEKVYIELNYSHEEYHAENLRAGEEYTVAYVLYDQEGRMLSMGMKTLAFPESLIVGVDIYGPKPQDWCKIILMDADAVPRSHAIRILFTAEEDTSS